MSSRFSPRSRALPGSQTAAACARLSVVVRCLDGAMHERGCLARFVWVSGAWRWGGGDLVGVGVVVEEFGVAAPVDGDVELLLGVVGAESLLEDVEEESSAHVGVGAVV